uniref:Uncharacterized protein n=1 Tax=Heterorhabditis bacteriophora TaxID=37862 RepID=A0A1I7WBJ9_HETBA
MYFSFIPHKELISFSNLTWLLNLITAFL